MLQSGSGILSSPLLNWIQLPGKVLLLKENKCASVTPNLGGQVMLGKRKRKGWVSTAGLHVGDTF